MKKLALAAVTVFAVAAIATGVASGSGGGGVLIDEGFACSLLDGNGDSFVTTDTQLWLYSNQRQTKLKLLCNGDGAPAPSLTYFNYDNTGLTCSVPGGYTTTDWQDKVGRNGNSQLTCSVIVSDILTAAKAGGSAGIG
jgi:hypothetical protein